MRSAIVAIPEIEQEDPAVVGEEDVLRRDVAVDDVERLPLEIAERVGVVETGERVDQDADVEIERDPLEALTRALAEGSERLAVEVLHREEVDAPFFADLVRLHDIRVAHSRGDAGLVEEQRDELGLARERRA